MAIDLDELIQLLRQVPEQRAALRRAIFGDEPDLASSLSALTQQMGALAEAQTRTEQRLDALAEAQTRTEQRLEALAEAQTRTEQRLEALAEAQQRTEQRLEALAEAQQRTEQRVDELAKDLRALTAAQRATEDSLKALVDTVRGMNDRLARLDGDALERRYRERGHAYLARVARRLRFLSNNDLGSLVDDAERTELLTPAQASSVLLADAAFAGRRRDDDTPVHLVVEASVTIDRHDVRRARERADLLARIVDTPVLAVVAGEFAPRPVVVAAQDAEVWCVTNGRTIAPADDLDE